MLSQCHGNAVCLFAAGAGRTPDTQGLIASRQLLHMLGQPLKVPGLAEKIGFIGREQVNADLPLRGAFVALNQCEVFRIGIELVIL